MKTNYYLRFSLLIVTLCFIFSSQSLSQTKFSGKWEGNLIITSYSYPTWGKVLAQGLIDVDFDSLKAIYNVVGFGKKEFNFKLEEKENFFQSKIILDLPEFDFAETVLEIKTFADRYLFAEGFSRTTSPYNNALLSLRKED